MNKIWIDAFGCDSPDELLFGTALARDRFRETVFCLPGDKLCLTDFFEKNKLSTERIMFFPASQVITNDENPLAAVMKKRDATMFTCFRSAVSDDFCPGVITAGSTGAALAGGAAFIGRMSGVTTPVLASFLPGPNNHLSVLADCGANVDCTPESVSVFALLASALSESLGTCNPSVALVSVGTEPTKGNSFSKKAFELLAAQPIRFVGNMEARDALSGRYDCLVCDGFTGNVLLKAIEGAALFTMGVVADSFSAEDSVLPDSVRRRVLSKLDMQSLAGAMVLGLRKPVIKLHGSANRKSVPAAVGQLLSLAGGDYASIAEKKLADRTK